MYVVINKEKNKLANYTRWVAYQPAQVKGTCQYIRAKFRSAILTKQNKGAQCKNAIKLLFLVTVSKYSHYILPHSPLQNGTKPEHMATCPIACKNSKHSQFEFQTDYSKNAVRRDDRPTSVPYLLFTLGNANIKTLSGRTIPNTVETQYTQELIASGVVEATHRNFSFLYISFQSVVLRRVISL